MQQCRCFCFDVAHSAETSDDATSRETTLDRPVDNLDRKQFKRVVRRASLEVLRAVVRRHHHPWDPGIKRLHTREAVVRRKWGSLDDVRVSKQAHNANETPTKHHNTAHNPNVGHAQQSDTRALGSQT